MSTATVQQIGQDLATWLGLAQRGDTVAIMDHGQVIAQLGPPTSQPEPEAQPLKSMADWLTEQDQRMQQIFGDRIIADSAALLDDQRADRA
jgi:antitoxin (DNA-binding transcriptional repressor) of toxin-antitoxin stability system